MNPKIGIAIGAVALVIGVVALVIGIDAKNSTSSNEEVAQQVQKELGTLKTEDSSGFGKLITAQRAAARERRQLQTQVKRLEADDTSSSQSIAALETAVKVINTKIAEINKEITKLQKRVDNLGG
jgi:septal ring factor EnvC (AmiA/AmiB activator)